MSDERRYSDDDIRKIVEHAASPRSASPVSADGLTLAELQAIGEEIGVSPERISEAATALAAPALSPRRNVLGMPVSVNRKVTLPRPPTDDEWERLLVELRATFGAQGKDTSRGNLREWRNGNLFACIEPLAEGFQLRMGTTKGNAGVVNGVGSASILVGLFTFGTLVATNDLAGANAVLPVLWGMVGGGAFGLNALRLPRWARARDAQMGHIADRARTLVSGPSPANHLAGEKTS